MFVGSKVRLDRMKAEHIPKLMAWEREWENTRLQLSDIASPASEETWGRRLEHDNKNDHGYFFGIWTHDDDRLIGAVGLSGVVWHHRHCGLGITIENAHQGMGFGTDALAIVLRFAFDELNLHRVELGVFSYNIRAIQLYERLGFTHEGRNREWGRRDGAWFDLVHMGILEGEWRQGIA